MLAFISRIF